MKRGRKTQREKLIAKKTIEVEGNINKIKDAFNVINYLLEENTRKLLEASSNPFEERSIAIVQAARIKIEQIINAEIYNLRCSIDDYEHHIDFMGV